MQKVLFSIIILLLLSISIGFGQEVDYEIYAIQFGKRTHYVPLKDVAVGTKSADSTQVYFMFWLLKNPSGKLIMVDAGFTEDAGINPKYIQFTQPDSLLAELHVSPDSISEIIITHPHWDHIGGIDLYPNAKVWMQRKDYEYFVGQAWQEGGNSGGFNKKDVEKIVSRNLEEKLVLIDGDSIEIMPGITVMTGSKHTYESQYVLVGKNTDRVILASDNAWFYYNLESELPIPITHSEAAYKVNLNRMKKMVRDLKNIIPGHDPIVFKNHPIITEHIVRIR